MKYTTWQLFKMAFAIAAGYELGRTVPVGLLQALNKHNRAEIKKRYRKGLQAVPNEQKATVTNWDKWSKSLRTDGETPTGD